MKTELITVDLDGTLLKSDKSISKYTVDIFRECQARGIPIIFATARSPASILRFLDMIPADGIIANGGATAEFTDEFGIGREIYRAVLDIKTANEIIRRFLKLQPEIDISVETNETFYHNYPSGLLREMPESFARYHVFTQELSDPFVHKITVKIDRKSAFEIAADFPDVGVIPFFGEPWVRFAHINATKWKALSALADYLGINPKHIAAFGDDYNDIDMLENCGISVAMDNAVPEAKAAAEFITSSNDNDGVAAWIEKNILPSLRESNG